MNIIKSYIVTNAASSQSGAGSGTVTSFSSGNLSPLFTTSVATATTTPALTFTAVNQNANLVYAGPATGAAAAPTFRALVAADIPLTSTQVAFGDGSNKISSSANFTFDSTNSALTVNSIRILATGTNGAKGHFVGYTAGNTNVLTVSDGFNTGFGYQALDAVIDGANFFNSSYNSAFGYQSGTALTTARHASLFGYRSGASITTGANNTLIGSLAGQSLTTQTDNTYIGYNTGSAATNTGLSNTFIGSSAGALNTSGDNAVFVGLFAGATNTTGDFNTFIGSEAGETNTTGSYNAYLGHWSGLYVRGSTNTFLGADVWAQVAVNPSSGDGNTGVGYRAGLTDIIANASTSGDNNTYIGKESGLGSTTQVSKSTALGYRAKVYTSLSMTFGSEIDADRVNYGYGGESYGSGKGVSFFKKAITNPTGAPTDGFILYSDVTNGDAYIWNAADGAAFKIGAASAGGWAVTGTTTITGNTVVDFGATGTTPYTNEFRADNLTTTTTVGRGLLLNNNQAATGGVTVQYSPNFVLRGRAWTGAASQTVDFMQYVLPATAATPTGKWVLASSINGGALVNAIRVDSDGVNIGIQFNAGGATLSGTTNGLFSLSGAGIVRFNGTQGSIQYNHATGSVGIASGVISIRNLNANTGTTTGTHSEIGIGSGWNPASGTAVYNMVIATQTINNAGSGIAKLFNIAPTWTAQGGDAFFIDYSPTVTSITGVHYCFRATAGLMSLPASTTGSSSFRIAHGSAPSSPVDGDIWTTTAGLFVRVNGSTVGPLS